MQQESLLWVTGMQIGTAALEDRRALSYKAEPHDPAIALLGICPNEWKTCVHRGIYPRLFWAAVAPMVQTWKQPKCRTVGDWMHSLPAQTREHYSAAAKKGAVKPCADLEET